MKQTFQDKNAKQTVLEHGFSVWKSFKQLYQHMKHDSDNYYIHPLPSWIETYKFQLLPFLEKDFKHIKAYLILHDCGKPFCLSEDNQGQHFKNHAEVSKQTFLKYYNDPMIAQLIGDDMLCHITKPKDFETLINHPNIEIMLCCALAELHSNAQMFGGFDSDSFKIKFKNLSKLGDRILKAKLGQIGYE